MMTRPAAASVGTAVRHVGTQAPVVVLGMHRSGTSLTARLLRDLGWYLGDDLDLLGPREDNPEGFFERADVQVLNDALLADLGASWDAPPSESSLEDGGRNPKSAVDDLVNALAAGSGSRGFALKDPRLCVLWPYWDEALADATLVLTLRHPGEVALSLRRRDGLPLLAGTALWEFYAVRAARACAGRRAVLVRYEDLVTDPAAAGRLAEALGVPAPPGLSAAVRPELHREHYDQAAAELLTTAQQGLWDRLCNLPSALDGDDVAAVAGEVSTTTVELLTERRGRVLAERGHSLTAAAAETRAQELMGRLDADNERLSALVAEHEAALARLAEKARTAEDSLTRAEALASADADQREAAHAKATEAARRAHEQQLEERSAALRAVRLEVNEAVAHRHRLEAELTDAGRRLDQVSTELDEARALHVRTEAAREGLSGLVETLRTRRLEQAARETELRTALEGAQRDLARALEDGTRRSAEVREQRHRERVLTFERDNLVHAVTVIEVERRSLERRLRAVVASRSYRWSRSLRTKLPRRGHEDPT